MPGLVRWAMLGAMARVPGALLAWVRSRLGTGCTQCDVYSAGSDGTCSTCGDGDTPNADRTSCVNCGVGTAGTGGELHDCGVGQEPNADRTACQACAVGYAGDRRRVACASSVLLARSLTSARRCV